MLKGFIAVRRLAQNGAIGFNCLMEIGSLISYRLDTCDVTGITARRDNFAWYQGRADHKHPHEHGTRGASGHQAHIGIPVEVGQAFPALVVAVHGERLNLQVFLDGNDVQWVAGVPGGEGPGTWQPSS